MKLQNEIRRQLGLQLRESRLKQKQGLSCVADQTRIEPKIIDFMELGLQLGSWKNCLKLLKYYRLKIKITLEDDT